MGRFRNKPDNVQWLTPYLTVADARRALDFYTGTFGFTAENELPGEDGSITHAELRHKGEMVLMLGPEGAYGSDMKAPASSGNEIPLNFYVYVDDVDAFYDKVKGAGAKPSDEPQDMFWGDRMFNVTDPDGYRWTFASNFGDFDPSKVPQG